MAVAAVYLHDRCRPCVFVRSGRQLWPTGTYPVLCTHYPVLCFVLIILSYALYSLSCPKLCTHYPVLCFVYILCLVPVLCLVLSCALCLSCAICMRYIEPVSDTGQLVWGRKNHLLCVAAVQSPVRTFTASTVMTLPGRVCCALPTTDPDSLLTALGTHRCGTISSWHRTPA